MNRVYKYLINVNMLSTADSKILFKIIPVTVRQITYNFMYFTFKYSNI